MTERVLIVEDHALVATGLQLSLSARGWIVETTSGPTADDVVAHARRIRPRCVLLDIDLGPAVGSGVDLVRPLRDTGADVVMLTAETRRSVLASCIEAGAAGWVGKDQLIDEVVAALEAVVAGVALLGRGTREAMLHELRAERAGRRRALSPFEGLTQRERTVLAALMDGLSADEIAEAHIVSLATVRSQIRAVLGKLGVRSQLAAVAAANRAGWRPSRHHADVA